MIRCFVPAAFAQAANSCAGTQQGASFGPTAPPGGPGQSSQVQSTPPVTNQTVSNGEAVHDSMFCAPAAFAQAANSCVLALSRVADATRHNLSTLPDVAGDRSVR